MTGVRSWVGCVLLLLLLLCCCWGVCWFLFLSWRVCSFFFGACSFVFFRLVFLGFVLFGVGFVCAVVFVPVPVLVILRVFFFLLGACCWVGRGFGVRACFGAFPFFVFVCARSSCFLSGAGVRGRVGVRVARVLVLCRVSCLCGFSCRVCSCGAWFRAGVLRVFSWACVLRSWWWGLRACARFGGRGFRCARACLRRLALSLFLAVWRSGVSLGAGGLSLLSLVPFRLGFRFFFALGARVLLLQRDARRRGRACFLLRGGSGSGGPLSSSSCSCAAWLVVSFRVAACRAVGARRVSGRWRVVSCVFRVAGDGPGASRSFRACFSFLSSRGCCARRRAGLRAVRVRWASFFPSRGVVGPACACGAAGRLPA